MNYIKFNKRMFIVGLALALLSLMITLKFEFSIRACIVFMIFFIIIGSIQFTLTVSYWIYGVFFVAISTFEVMLVQMLLNEHFSGSLGLFGLNILCVSAFILFIFIVTANFHISVGAGLFIPLFLATVNYYVYSFRGSEFQPIDILSIATAYNVVESYDIELVPTILYAWEFAILLCFFCFNISNVSQRKRKGRLMLGIAEVCIVLALLFGINDLHCYHWKTEGSVFNGYILNFCLQLREVFVAKPDEYTPSSIKEYESEYENTITSQDSTENPAIIVIMDESFSDLSVLGNELVTNIEVTPFLDSLSENTIRGYALSSVLGGNTPNSEFEFLTGHTMAFLPNGCIPYQQYIKSETSSLVSSLNGMGYYSFATHPYLADGWMRTTVYPLLQFNTFTFIEDYPQTNLLRDFVSDQEMFERIIKYYEARDKTQEFFLFGVTMQNHGGYTYDKGASYKTTVHLSGYQGDYPDVEQYLTLIHETDKAIEYLLSYFKGIDDPVVIVFFGDHQPNLDSYFLEEAHGGTFETLDEQELRYIVPFFIWANYDIEEDNVNLTSLNYLSTYLMEVAGLDMTAYQQFLYDTRKVIPAINAYGYYSIANNCFMSIEEADGEEAEILMKYQHLQYNGLFDKTNQSDIFFPN